MHESVCEKGVKKFVEIVKYLFKCNEIVLLVRFILHLVKYEVLWVGDYYFDCRKILNWIGGVKVTSIVCEI